MGSNCKINQSFSSLLFLFFFISSVYICLTPSFTSLFPRSSLVPNTISERLLPKSNLLDQISSLLVPTSSMASSDVLPRFYSVYLSQYSSDSLVIPSSYYQHLPRRLPKTAILTGTGGRFWRVAMMSKREQVYFDQGWGDFVADNELKDGEFLTFVFDGHQCYEVSIYGRGGCKETRAIIQVEEISDDTEAGNDSHHSLNNDSLQTDNDSHHSLNKDSLQTDNDSHHSLNNDSLQTDNDSHHSLNNDSLQTDNDSHHSLNKDSLQTNDEMETDDEMESDSDYSPDNLAEAVSAEAVEVVDTRTMTSRSRMRDKTIENPEQYLDDPNNICFETSLKRRKYELLVGAQFVKDYCLKFGNKVDYIDGHGTLTAKAMIWKDQRVCVKKWHKICDRNKLTENDSILCEVLRSNDDKVVYAIKIHIIRDGAALT